MAKKKTQEQEPQEQTPADLGIEAVVPQHTYRYQPQEDITAHELALMMPVFVAITAEVDAAAILEGLPDGVRRHWVEWEQE